MSYNATVLQVLIASPSDVNAQRDEIEKAIYEWNNEHSKDYEIVLLPKRWEKDLMPNYAYGDVQGEINKQIVNSADMLIGIFGYRFGSPTKNAPSGTIEELNIFIESKKPIMIYFDEPKQIDLEYAEQAALLKKFKNEYSGKGIYFNYEDGHQIRKHLLHQVKTYKDNKQQQKERIMQAVLPETNVDRNSKRSYSNSAEKVITEFDRPIPPTAELIFDTLDLSDQKSYSSSEKSGVAKFNYSNNDGKYSIGSGDFLFETSWSKSGDTSIQVHTSGTMRGIGYKFGQNELPHESLIRKTFDFSSHHRRPNLGEIIIWVNNKNKYAATKTVEIIDNGRPTALGRDDEVVFEYCIFDGDFSDLPI
ncbi:hypothetical protein [Paenibacillus hunanensis]|uniref:DUF4062 domain-containing protein n=1 Tax=Paenibacillus hunanensis TaxID=539262 RepID=A0ABU1IW84_9BACL|nr:hypothetical protein [Paenibacillus hunanensis]MDR6243519.1 hypothetical protein [Paenibacillus hunanensis]GGI98328.1 hypothetical protein GCM10008022_03830 [Paenibacillus hunanensis]